MGLALTRVGGLEQVDKVLAFVGTLSEDSLRLLVKNLFRREFKIAAEITHGPGEHGADVIAGVGPDDDPMEKHQVFLIQVKTGDVGLSEWRSGLCGQLAELYHRTHTIPGLGDTLPRRILLIVSGRLKPEVLHSINEWNAKLPIPVELMDGIGFAEFLHARVYDEPRIRRELLEEAPLQGPGLTSIG